MLSKNSPNRLLVDTLKLASKLVLCKAKFAVNHIDCSIRVFCIDSDRSKELSICAMHNI